VLEWDQATSIAPFQMIFEIGERILPVFAIRRSHRLLIEIDDPLSFLESIAAFRAKVSHMRPSARCGRTPSRPEKSV
jgi:hypothetical protein